MDREGERTDDTISFCSTLHALVVARTMCWRETSLSTTSRILVLIMLSWQSAVVAVEGVAFRIRVVVAWREIVAGCTRISSQIDGSRKVPRVGSM